MKTILKIVVMLLCSFAGYWVGRGPGQPVTTDLVRIDTVFYSRPEPVRKLPPAFASVRLPRVLFAPGDTVVNVVVATDPDSAEVRVAVVQHEYSDSTYRLRITGPAIGELGPSLEWIETYNKTTTQLRTGARRSRFAVTAGVGAAYTPRGFQPYAGIGAGVILWQW